MAGSRPLSPCTPDLPPLPERTELFLGLCGLVDFWVTTNPVTLGPGLGDHLVTMGVLINPWEPDRVCCRHGLKIQHLLTYHSLPCAGKYADMNTLGAQHALSFGQ